MMFKTVPRLSWKHFQLNMKTWKHLIIFLILHIWDLITISMLQTVTKSASFPKEMRSPHKQKIIQYVESALPAQNSLIVMYSNI